MDNLLFDDKQDLKKLPSVDIYIQYKKIYTLYQHLDKAVNYMKEIDKTIDLLETCTDIYTKTIDKFETCKELLDNNTLFSKEEINKMDREATLHTKMKVINDYKTIEKRYRELIECYNMIDKDCYRQILKRLSEELI